MVLPFTLSNKRSHCIQLPLAQSAASLTANPGVVGIGHEIIFTAIPILLLIQEGQLSVASESLRS